MVSKAVSNVAPGAVKVSGTATLALNPSLSKTVLILLVLSIL
jgi:hypothetical protein